MQKRVRIISVVVYMMFAVIAGDLVYIQLIRGNYFFKLSRHNRIRVVPLEGERGRILDRNGVELANSRISFDVMVTPQEMQDKEGLFSYLSYVLKTDRKVLLNRFHRKKFTPFAPVVVAEDVTREQAFILEENKFRFPSLLIQKNYRRNYPFKTVGAHALGYIGKISREKMQKMVGYGYSLQSVVGYAGLEEVYDEYLNGENGGLQIEVNSQGQQVRLLGIRNAKSGKDITVTIDNRMQLLAMRALNNKPGAILIMDANSGEILSMISMPAFDPNYFVSARMKKEVLSFFKEEVTPLFNRTIMGQCPPGSVFKIPIATAALETGKVGLEEKFLCKGYFSMGRRRIRCAHVHGEQSLIPAIAHSCNVYFVNVGLRLGSEIIAKYAKLFGLGQKTGIDLPFEKAGQIPSSKWRRLKFNRGWYKGDTANLSIGQGDILVTPLQLVRMMAAVANGGNLVSPHLIKSIDHKELKIVFPARRVRIKDETLAKIQEGLRAVVTDPGGTARALNLKGLTLSGKTGTAQTVPGKNHHSWFVGYSVSENRTLAFCVFLEYGGSSYYAVQVTKELFLSLQRRRLL